jgi:hypothetical protein
MSPGGRAPGLLGAIVLLLLAMVLQGTRAATAGGAEERGPAVAAPKITFDLTALDDEGLVGPPDGLVAVAYEFCIPATPAHAAEVQRLDPTAQVQAGARGRIGCGPGQWLVVGSTHQAGWRAVLERLAALDYVARIDRAYFE